MTKSMVAACLVATSLAWVSCVPLSSPAAAAGSALAVTVSPQSVSPVDQYYQTTGALQGTGAVVTLRVGPNNVLRPNFPVEVQECDAGPVSLDDCDMLTTLTYDQLTGKRVYAAANGSVSSFHFVVWSPLPAKWDPASVITVGPGHPTSLWIGDDPSQWATTGIVSAPVQIGRTVKPSAGPSTSVVGPSTSVATASLRDAGANPHPGNGLGWLVALGLAVLAVLVCLVAFGVRRRRATRS
jgi:hypothetical protein